MGGFKTLKGRDVEHKENFSFNVSFVASMFSWSEKKNPKINSPHPIPHPK